MKNEDEKKPEHGHGKIHDTDEPEKPSPVQPFDEPITPPIDPGQVGQPPVDPPDGGGNH